MYISLMYERPQLAGSETTIAMVVLFQQRFSRTQALGLSGTNIQT